MKTRHLVLSLAAVASLAFAAPVLAADGHFSHDALNHAHKGGKGVLIVIDAPNCTPCAAQAAVVAQLQADPKLKDLTVLRAHAGQHGRELQGLGANPQTGIIAFKHGREIGRINADAPPAAVSSLIAAVVL